MILSSVNIKNNYVKPFGNKNSNNNVLQNQSAQKNVTESMNPLKRMEIQERANAKQGNSVIEQSLYYSNQLRATRMQQKSTTLEKKKLQYNFKKVSSQILRSKTSVSARKAVQAASREVTRLKRLKSNGDYDEEELQLAIDHAKSMERVAKKKVKHLEQEEMVERHGKGTFVEYEDEKEEEIRAEDRVEYTEPEDMERMLTEAALSEGEIDEEVFSELSLEDMESLESMEEISMAMSDMLEQMYDSMSELMEELDLSELSESMFAPDPNMPEEDLKLFKQKHRNKEMKEITKADMDYLKGLMEHNQKQMESGGVQLSSGSADFSGAIAAAPTVDPGGGGVNVIV
ncbi:MAG: hypothetical protein K6F37_05615 [Lachnospiraceae bacterium]|nr:hypothetical protein [Lachnospiraceae bacterium]